MYKTEEMIILFKTHLVLRLKDVVEHMNRSRTSIMRYFNEIGYYTSYNHAGEYYTLKMIPAFDKNGLWKYRSAYFSSHGSLRDAAKALVDESESGYTHNELKEILGIRMYNTLLDLVSDGLISRYEYDGEYIYVSHEQEQQEKQIATRENTAPKMKIKKEAVKRAPRITPAAGLNEIIEVLLAYIGGHMQPGSAYSHLHRKGVNVTPRQIQVIFEFYDLGKKNSF
jgi:hypothetical protein